MPYWLIADILVAVHVAYVTFVVLAVPVIAAGWLLDWGFVRNSWFRNAHVAMIGIVVAESLCGIPCPLTRWEHEYRLLAGESGYTGSFIGHFLNDLLFFDFAPWVFTTVYCAFGAVVVALYVFVPPRWLGRLRPAAAS